MKIAARLLGVVYIFLALFTVLWAWIGWGLISIGNGNPLPDLVFSIVVTVFFVAGAIELWRTNMAKTLLGKFLAFGPAVMVLLYILYLWYLSLPPVI